MHRKFLTLAAVPLSGIAIAAPFAYASGSVPFVFGHGGTGVPLTAACTRQPVSIPLGRTWMAAKPGVERVWTIQSAELKCLTRKVHQLEKQHAKPAPDPCWGEQAPPPLVSEAPADKQGYHDEKGAAALQAWALGLYECELAQNGGVAP